MEKVISHDYEESEYRCGCGSNYSDEFGSPEMKWWHQIELVETHALPGNMPPARKSLRQNDVDQEQGPNYRKPSSNLVNSEFCGVFVVWGSTSECCFRREIPVLLLKRGCGIQAV
jgi:hypothetical protein